MDLYIYYRVRSEHADALRAQAAAMQRCLSQEYGIVTGLKRRPEERDGRQTWMEIYQAVPDGFAAILERAAAQAGLARLIDGQRNTEYFLDVPTCA
ncbi:DUF4936 family protein [Noviherbaspirillum autotrophicum]|uniref:DUF4936 domain-containing protein n=1 Tax=Noviherbaspirillum autotrophicum TaxID=709839 RepID=A0A0C2BR36_9BURK|nr:DUF4936 family protein [Noviherbaspirillum autotrophicum]KIF82539.1 hypothetical protein TSA66_19735 [Noviherbaspirillum autotrophicum]